MSKQSHKKKKTFRLSFNQRSVNLITFYISCNCWIIKRWVVNGKTQWLPRMHMNVGIMTNRFERISKYLELIIPAPQTIQDKLNGNGFKLWLCFFCFSSRLLFCFNATSSSCVSNRADVCLIMQMLFKYYYKYQRAHKQCCMMWC